jgi:hypothetical protein
MASEQVKRWTLKDTEGCERYMGLDDGGPFVRHDDYTTLLARCEQAEATVAACKAAGFVDAKGKVVRFEKQYWRADTEGDSCEDLEELADSCGDGEFLEVTPLLILPRELYVVQVNADGTGSHREATTEERQRWEQAEREWRERAKVLPTRTAAEAARGGEQG